MKVITIPVAAIDAADRSRPVNPNIAAQLAEDIRRRGLRQPVEVTKAGDGWRLVSGGHRLEAHRLLGHKEIDAVEVKGSALELRRDELLENLARSELTALERAVALADLKGIFQEIHPEAKHGGDRSQEQDATLASWYGEVASRSERSERTIKRAASIGARLSAQTVARLTGTEFEDSQKDLELLSKQGPDNQALICGLLFRNPNPVPSVADAIAILEGRTKSDDATEKALKGLLAHWNRAPKEVRRSFVMGLPEEELVEFMAARGFALTQVQEAAE